MTLLYADTAGDGPPLLLLHGFTGSTRSWDVVRPALNGFARTIAVDLIGHSRSPSPPAVAAYGFEACLRDLLAVLDRFDVRRADVLGYSMGGRLALQLALAAPERIDHLVLESASPGIEDTAERQRRVETDAQLADRLERDGIDAFVADWERQPLLALAPHVSQAVRDHQHAQRLQNAPLGLANSLRGMGTGQQTPVWEHLPRLACPTTLIVGELDQRYCAIARRMHARLPHAHLATVPQAGHTVHLDQPDRFVALVQHACRSDARSS